MDLNHLKPVLDDGAVPERRRRGIAGEERRRGQRFALDALHGNSLLLLSLLCRLGDFPTGGGLLFHGLDDTHGHSLPHVAHSEAAFKGMTDTRRGSQIRPTGWFSDSWA